MNKWVYYHNPLWGHHHQIGIVISETNDTLITSIPHFRGDYLCIKKNDASLRTDRIITKEEKLMTMSKFGAWWFEEHKNAFQSVLIHDIL